MSKITLTAKQWLSHWSARWVALPLLGMAAIGAVISQVAPPSPPAIPAVSLASEPLYARGIRSKPTLTLALSVEFPTVGQAYPASDVYSPANEYLGYFDASSCYTYNDTHKRFERSGAATSRACGGSGFSGNFMNWATTSAIDILRYGLTGGDRITDTATETVLQRAVIPENFYNSANFSSKTVSGTIAAGAIPSVVLGSPAPATVYIANCLNRVHFGTAFGGSCSSPGSNGNLGTLAGSSTTAITAPRPAGFTRCAGENETCSFTGTMEVIYGADTTSGGATGAYAAPRIATGSIACNNYTFGDPLYGTGKACYYRPVPTLAPAAVNLTSDAFYTTRVSVCNSTGGALTDPRTDLCLRYPSGNYKPVGNLQKYSDKMRVAAFGYLRDDALGRYGGVLRAPMKYVGPKAYDANFNLISGTNSGREWDESTGVFYENPDTSTEFSVSGVTNYLNRFGRTGATPGVYKTYDPVGELYYEALRYIQGLPPTPAAISGLSAGSALKDGYPVYETWTDPHPQITGLGSTGDYSCVKNNILTIGDVNTHADKTIPGNTRVSSSDVARAANLAGNEPNFMDWTRVVGAFESNHTEVTYPYVRESGTPTTESVANPNTANTARWGLENQTPGCCNNNSYYMAGMAYWANTHDIRGTSWTAETTKQRPGMRAKSYFIDVNEYGNQTNATTRQNNQFYLAAKYGGFIDRSDRGNPFYDESGTVDNTLWQQSNGDARTYHLAGNPRALIDALEIIFEQIASEANSIAGGAITTQTLTASAESIFGASFDPSDWSGDLISYTLALNGDGSVAVGSEATAEWRAATVLDNRTTPRNIVVGKTTATAAGAATNFEWSAIGADHQDALRLPPGGTAGVTPLDAAVNASAAAAAASGEGRLQFIRGDRSKESPAGPYRRRGSRLGDIVNSGVIFKGAPSTGVTGDGYASFYETNASRTRALYVGANDGMLHAFNAANGTELFAYIPSFVVSKLPDLTSTSYTHRSYVDATPTVAEAQLNTSDSGSWKTVLVSGAGGGGQGVFALDVTNPSSFTASSVLWEFTDRDDSALGNVVGRPKILKIRVSGDEETTPVYKWFAVVASGVNNYVDDGRFSTTGYPALFFLELGKPAGSAWVEGQNYFKVRFPHGSTAIASGMVGFSATGGTAGEVAKIYAGDLQGNLWKLDFSTSPAANATAVNVSSMLGGAAATLNAANPFHIARSGLDGTGPVQAITMDPALAFGPNRSIIVIFGTGKFLEVSDTTGPFGTQSFYALLDQGEASIPGKSHLAAMSQDAATGALTGPAFVWGIPGSARDTTVRPGWYFDFAGSGASGSAIGSGERQISNVGLFGGKVIFGSVIPAANGCDSGSGRLYIASLATGGGTSTVSTVGVMGEPFVVKTGATESATDGTGRSSRTTSGRIIIQGSAGVRTLSGAEGAVTGLDPGYRRLNWRQIHNYQDLKAAYQ